MPPRRRKKIEEIINVEKINELHTATQINIVEKKVENIVETYSNKCNNVLSSLKKETLINKDLSKNNLEKTDEKEVLNKKKKKDKNVIILKRPKINIINKDCYKNILRYINKNKIEVQNMLYKKKILRNKNVPMKLLFTLFVNYINNDIEIKIL